MPMTPFPPLDRTSSTFKNDVDTLFGSRIPNFVTEANAMQASLNSIAAGGAYALPFNFATTGGTGTTTGGKIACANIANQSATTYFAIDLTDAKGSSIAVQLAQAAASTNTVKGSARLVKMGDASKYIILNITGWSASANSGLLAGTVVDSSSTNPFSSGDSVMLYLQRAGDKGDTGATGQQDFALLASATVGSAVAYIDFLTVFTSGYDHYIIDINNLGVTGANNLSFSFITGGSTVDGSSLYYLGASDGSSPTPVSSFSFGILGSAASSAMNVTLEVRNANSVGKPKGFSARGWSNGSSIIKEGAWYNLSAAPSGFRLTCTSTTFTAGSVRVYGIKNS
jgi:hypothetical protein